MSSVLCQHCGDTIECGDGNDKYHTVCLQNEIPRCKRAVTSFLDFYSTDKVENIFYLGIHVRYLYGYTKQKQKQEKQDKRRKRENKLKELVRKVCALRNSNSGSILIQLVGIDPGDSFTGTFDEFADTTLNNIIEDGKMFSDVFHRERMNRLEMFSEFSDFIVLRVAAATFLTTSEFKTKIALDDGILNPSPQNIFQLLKEKRKYPEEHPAFKNMQFAEDLEKLEECRSIQLKANFKEDEENTNAEDLIAKVFYELKLNEYISTFSKNSKGGTYLFGVGEKPRVFEDRKYTSRKIDIHGVLINDTAAFKEGIERLVKEEMLVCDFSGERLAYEDIVTVDFIPFRVSEERLNKYVLKITVRPVHGIVFFDKNGPQAYKVEHKDDPKSDTKETEISVKEWFSIILKHLEKDA